MKKIILFLIIVVMFCFSVNAYTLYGTVEDENRYPLEMVVVWVKDTALIGYTDSKGNFEIEVPEDKLYNKRKFNL